MRRFINYSIFFCLLRLSSVSSLHAVPAENSYHELNHETGKYIGYIIGNQFKDSEIELSAIREGLEEFERGKAPQMDRRDFLKAFQELEEKKAGIEPQENLMRSEKFLREIANKKRGQEIIPSKLYAAILRYGKGTKVIKNRGLFHICCRTIMGNTLLDTKKNNAPIIQDLDNAISGFSWGVKGMKLGERRKLFIHPELAYSDFALRSPNMALIIDVELLSIYDDE